MTALSALLALAAAMGASAAAPQTLSMDQAVALALAQHPQVEAAKAQARATLAGQRAARGRLLPAAHVSDVHNFSHLNLHGLEQHLAGNTGTAPAFFSPNAAANLLQLSVRQPLLGLLGQSQALRAAGAEHAAALAATAVSRNDLTLQVRSQYLALFQARALADTARASERALLEQVEDAEHKFAAGALASTDVLRPRAAAAAARQRAIAAAASEEIARSSLLELLGLTDAGEQVNFREPEAGLDGGDIAHLPLLRAEAMRQRPELAEAGASAQAAKLRARTQTLALLPSIDAQAAWMHLFAQERGGRQIKSRADAYFVGISASWPAWQWGSHFYEQQAARARAAQAEHLRAATERRIGTELAQRHANVQACAGAVQAALAEVSSAEEAYRVMLATLAVDAATTSDLLQTEAAQTQARMNLVRARYDLALAKVALEHALGREG